VTRRLSLLLLIAALAAAGAPAAAQAQTPVDITSAGPLQHIFLSNVLGCQVQYAGDAQYSFFSPSSQVGSCSTGLVVNGTRQFATPVSQTAITGNGARANPFRVVTVATFGDFSSNPTLRIVQTDSYVTGDDYYRTFATVRNTGRSAQSVVLYRGADCYLQGSDVGFGFFDTATSAIYCSANANNSPAARIEGFAPLSPGSAYYEGGYSAATSPAGPYPSTCECTVSLDNGIGLSWNVTVPAGGSVTRSFATTFSPAGILFEPPPEINLDDLPAPTVGKEVNVDVVKGTVLVAVPARSGAHGSGARASQKGLDFVPLEEARQIPTGSILDTKRGTVQLVSARGAGSKTQNGKFTAGIFQVLQSRKKRDRGLTELRLKGSSFNSCRARGKRASASKLSSRTIRQLRGNAKGRFRTRGKHSAATVRGTKWIVADRCDGTLTKVQRGVVEVRDFRTKKTVTVRAGKSYLARARR
jgi:hypothetical protein